MNISDELRKLADLRGEDRLTEQEFAEAKRQILFRGNAYKVCANMRARRKNWLIISKCAKYIFIIFAVLLLLFVGYHKIVAPYQLYVRCNEVPTDLKSAGYTDRAICDLVKFEER